MLHLESIGYGLLEFNAKCYQNWPEYGKNRMPLAYMEIRSVIKLNVLCRNFELSNMSNQGGFNG